jgi:phosphotriesterase-related protein
VPTVDTVLGPIDAETLGFTLSHEHVLVAMGADNHHYPWLFDWERTRANIVRELREATWRRRHYHRPHDAGPRTRCRVRTRCGEVTESILSWRRESGGCPAFILGAQLDRIADIFVREIEVGIGETASRRGSSKSPTMRRSNSRSGTYSEAQHVPQAHWLPDQHSPLGACRGGAPSGRDFPG